MSKVLVFCNLPLPRSHLLSIKWKVTLGVPWLEESDQNVVFPSSSGPFANKDEQVGIWVGSSPIRLYK